MTFELFERLQAYDSQLYTAKYLGYARNLNTKARNELNGIYTEIFGEAPIGLLGGCNACIYNALKRLATVYFPFKDEIEVQKQYYDSPTEPIEAAEEPQDAEPIEAAEAPKAQQTQNKAPKTRRKKTDGNK